MNGFMTGGPVFADDQKITVEGFFPSIEMSEFMAFARLDGHATPERAAIAVIDAIDYVSGELDDFREAQEKAGIATLEELPGRVIDGENVQLHRYRRAVFSWAKAQLVEQYRDVDLTQDGADNAERLEATITSYRREAVKAIGQIAGESGSVIELL